MMTNELKCKMYGYDIMKISFKIQMATFVAVITIIFVGINTMCGGITKMDCQEFFLNK